MKQVYLNGRFIPFDQGRVSVEDRGFQFGDGAYEVIRVYSGRPFRLRPHLERLARTLQGLEIPTPEPTEKIEGVVREFSAEAPESMVYLQVTRGAAPRNHAFPRDAKPTFVAYAMDAKADPPGRAYSLATVPDDRWAHCDLKTICLLSNVLAKQKAARAGADEALFVRDDGAVTEGASSNAFLVRDGALYTHPATNRILNGISRLALIELAQASGLRVFETPFTREEALKADEFFMTRTSTEVMPIARIDGRAIGRGAAPGPVSRRLREGFDALIRAECRYSSPVPQ
ncbi:MAG TPA: D-amino acid aminotransferase [Planctomycetota bacterium]|nr:D-amino acid aminotransferase [Planctomycetota bacterium]